MTRRFFTQGGRVRVAVVYADAGRGAAEPYLLLLPDSAWPAFSRVARRARRLSTLRRYGPALPWRRVAGPGSPRPPPVAGGVDVVAAAVAREVAALLESEELGAEAGLAVRRAAESHAALLEAWEAVRAWREAGLAVVRHDPRSALAPPALRWLGRGRVVAAGGGVVVRAQRGNLLVSEGVAAHVLLRPGAGDGLAAALGRWAAEAETLLRLLRAGVEVARAGGSAEAAWAAGELGRALSLAELLLGG